MKKKVVSALSAAVIALNASSVVAFADSKSENLSYDGVSAYASLVCDFGAAWLGHSDNADATNSFTSSNTKGYLVAVRLECWGSDSEIGHKYDRGPSVAECTYSWTDVSYYESRNSIDNSSGTTELVVRNIHDNEGLG